ncbi:hypothetical protein SAMN05216388_10261 [Halorientalis persicus]|uniref:ASCH domain-containing protein n=1 Tax=Halorientalis persicus TaxID=1367881 RepID=A0A1H8U8C9_9EURY|nr:ASCH domain-containing protein [Halorientalis persicus]SEO98908.1 hypothetical protein SAMN05216388_10261 [Halorientalis persicus]
MTERPSQSTAGEEKDSERTENNGEPSSSPLRIKFDSVHIQPILDQEKTVTARLGSKYQSVHTGDTIVLCDETGEEVGRATVDLIGEHDAAYFARVAGEAHYEGHRSYRKVGQFLDQMRQYYPEKEIGPETEVVAISWTNVTVADEYDGGREAWRDGRTEAHESTTSPHNPDNNHV